MPVKQDKSKQKHKKACRILNIHYVYNKGMHILKGVVWEDGTFHLLFTFWGLFIIVIKELLVKEFNFSNYDHSQNELPFQSITFPLFSLF